MELKNRAHSDRQGNSDNVVRETERPDITTAQAPLESCRLSKGPSPPTQRSTEEWWQAARPQCPNQTERSTLTWLFPGPSWEDAQPTIVVRNPLRWVLAGEAFQIILQTLLPEGKSIWGWCETYYRRWKTRGRGSGGLRWFGRNKRGREDRKGDKCEWPCVNRLLISTVLWQCPVPDCCSLACLLIKLNF